VVGTLQPIKNLAKMAKSRGIAFHTDCVQSFGTLPISVDELGVDMLSVSSHKIHGPKGAGALFIRKGVRINSIIHGGEHEGGKRGGTENIPGIVGFARAAEISQGEIIERAAKTRAIRDKLVKGVLESIDDVIYNGHPEKRLPGNASFCFKYVEGESIVLYLDMESIATSSGSACASHSLEPSHVLIAMGMKPQDALGSLRISIGRGNTEKEVDYFLQVLPPIIIKLREMSPLYRNSYRL
jgi:cysteine desulfurase